MSYPGRLHVFDYDLILGENFVFTGTECKAQLLLLNVHCFTLKCTVLNLYMNKDLGTKAGVYMDFVVVRFLHDLVYTKNVMSQPIRRST